MEPREPVGTREDEAARYRTLLEINNALIANLTRDTLFRAIARALRQVVPYDRTAIFLHEPAREVLRLFVLESSLPSTYFVVGLELPVEDTHVGWAFRHRRVLLQLLETFGAGQDEGRAAGAAVNDEDQVIARDVAAHPDGHVGALVAEEEHLAVAGAAGAEGDGEEEGQNDGEMTHG